MAAKQFWLCTKLSIESDQRTPAFHPEGGNNDFDAAPAQRLADGRRPRAVIAAQQQAGYGYGITSKDAIKMAFTTKEAAQAYAKQEAGKNPNVVYGVFECCNVYETTTPQVIEKTFTAEGELRLVEAVA